MNFNNFSYLDANINIKDLRKSEWVKMQTSLPIRINDNSAFTSNFLLISHYDLQETSRNTAYKRVFLNKPVAIV